MPDKFQRVHAVHDHYCTESYANEEPAGGEHLPHRREGGHEATEDHNGEGDEIGLLPPYGVRELAEAARSQEETYHLDRGDQVAHVLAVAYQCPLELHVHRTMNY